MVWKVLLGIWICILPPALSVRSQIPYQIEQRSMPEGNDFKSIIPPRVADFIRIGFIPQGNGLSGEAVYKSPNQEIKIYFSKSSGPGSVKDQIKNLRNQSKLQYGQAAMQFSLTSNPAYLKLIGNGVALFAWTRGNYLFTVDAQNGDRLALETFMQFFPY